ncbi:MAG TPA: PDZ domain-containing protein [Pyrinomonadaceae bacterium]|nr:PDZ domain-containing protein [Pyrinomonadaceae bacterium]
MTRRLPPFYVYAANLLLLFLCSSLWAAAREESAPLASLNYRLAMSRPVSHLFEVTITAELAEGTRATHLDFQMPRWSPGRYAVFNFAKNVQEVQAAGGVCPAGAQCKLTPLPYTRIDDQTWRVPLQEGRGVTLKYKVFGDDLSGTFSQLDDRHANFNGASVFMYVVGHKQDPLRLTVDPPPGWRAVNASNTSADQREWRFGNYDLLIDAPTEIAPDWTVDEFKVDGKTYRVVVHSYGDEGGNRPRLVRDLEKIVRAQVAMWGAPEFDSYTFMIHFANDGRSVDGMEHLDSTNMIVAGTLADRETYGLTLELASHEFFHVWNVKRLRPVELGPWDFTRPLSTRGLWVAEGVTEYYGELMMRRAGLWTDAQLWQRLSEVIQGVENSQGSRLMSAEDSSLLAPFLDGDPEAQRTNLANTSVSYYFKGEVLALALDLLIRKQTGGRGSLDEVLRRLYQELYVKSPNASYYLRGRGFTSEDFERVTTEVGGAELKDFFTRYVRGVEVPPYDEAFGAVGLRLVREAATKPAIGFNFEADDARGGVKVKSVRNNSPGEDAGLKRDDVITTVGDKKVTGKNFEEAVGRFKQGERMPVTVNRDGQTLKKVITPGPPDTYTYRLEEVRDATAEQRRLRAEWMAGK